MMKSKVLLAAFAASLVFSANVSAGNPVGIAKGVMSVAVNIATGSRGRQGMKRTSQIRERATRGTPKVQRGWFIAVHVQSTGVHLLQHTHQVGATHVL